MEALNKPRSLFPPLGLASFGFALLILLGVISAWWNRTEPSSGSLRILVLLGFAIGAYGVGSIAQASAHLRKNKIADIVPPALTLLLSVLSVEALLRIYQVPEGLIPTPSKVLSTLWSVREVLMTDARQTVLLEAGTGYLLGAGLGVVFAILVSRVVFLERGLLPYVSALSSVPIVALAPVMVKIMGLDWPSKAVIVAITVFFPVAINTFRGLREINPLSLDLLASYGAKDFQQYLVLRLPSALPFIFNALKIGTTLAMIGAIVSEFFGANGHGLGFRIQIEAGRFGFDIVWSAIIVASVLGIFWYNLLGWLERRFTGWHVSFREQGGI